MIKFGAVKFILALWLLLTQPDPVALSHEGGIASEKVKLAHHYHGILHSIEDPSGEQYFFRNGQRCKLFTKAFEAWLRERKRKNDGVN